MSHTGLAWRTLTETEAVDFVTVVVGRPFTAQSLQNLSPLDCSARPAAPKGARARAPRAASVPNSVGGSVRARRLFAFPGLLKRPYSRRFRNRRAQTMRAGP